MGLTLYLLIDYNVQFEAIGNDSLSLGSDFSQHFVVKAEVSLTPTVRLQKRERRRVLTHKLSSKGSLTLCSRIQSFEQLQLLVQVEEWPAIYTWSSPMATRLACAAHTLYQNIPRISLEYSGTFPYKFHTVLVQSWYVSSHQECTFPPMYNIGPFSTSPYFSFVVFTTRFVTLT